MTKKKVKESVKKARGKSTGQIAVRKIGIPGIDMFRLNQLQAADYNPRVIAAEAMKGLMNSINRFGCVEPIVVRASDREAGRNICHPDAGPYQCRGYLL